MHLALNITTKKLIQSRKIVLYHTILELGFCSCNGIKKMVSLCKWSHSLAGPYSAFFFSLISIGLSLNNADAQKNNKSIDTIRTLTIAHKKISSCKAKPRKIRMLSHMILPSGSPPNLFSNTEQNTGWASYVHRSHQYKQIISPVNTKFFCVVQEKVNTNFSSMNKEPSQF